METGARDNGQFLSRNVFCQSGMGALKYFNKHDAREPKAVMKIHTLNASFQPSKIGQPHGLQVTYLKDKQHQEHLCLPRGWQGNGGLVQRHQSSQISLPTGCFPWGPPR
ncbi:hypothetical protein J4Q44_G00179950 [Coregonus suidteri]|uniref:Uncharacterized protein n=1 Tax=Coregonus suidteri TaxID=861788 RepID=A0AAN8M5J3_9TELE